jgi:monoamine oxidase
LLISHFGFFVLPKHKPVLLGSVFSQAGLATEIYDHTNVEETKFALKGFLNGSANHYTFEERKQKVITQLAHYFGEEAQNYASYNDKVWNDSFAFVGQFATL